jgi:hypothetical protein
MSQRTKNGVPKPDTRVIRLADLLALGSVAHGTYLDRHVRQNLSHLPVGVVTWPTRNIPAGTFQPERPRKNPPEPRRTTSQPHPLHVCPSSCPARFCGFLRLPLHQPHVHTATLIGHVTLSTPFPAAFPLPHSLTDRFAVRHGRRVEIKLVP